MFNEQIKRFYDRMDFMKKKHMIRESDYDYLCRSFSVLCESVQMRGESIEDLINGIDEINTCLALLHLPPVKNVSSF